MKIKQKIREYLEYGIDVLTMSIFLLLFLISIYAIFDVNKVNESAILDEQVAEMSPGNDDSDIDFASLKEINPEILAWIKINNTNINYPVVQAVDNRKYLVRDYRGEYATAGSIFLDYHNNGFKDDFSIVYGHRMSGENMFGGIIKFENTDYFNAHPSGMLYTEDATYNMNIISFSVIDIGKTTVYDLKNNKNGKNSSILQEVLNSAVNTRDMEVTAEDKLVLLSTCDKDSKHYRDVLLAKLEKI